MLPKEQWDALSDEEKQQRVNEKPEETSPTAEVKEAAVIFSDGSTRSLRNFVAEIVRKTADEVKRELAVPAPPATPPAPANSADFSRQVIAMAEREMTETGSVIPVNTILNLISQGSQYHLNQFNAITKESQRVIKTVKKELKKQYKDYGDYEEEFEDLIEAINPVYINKDGLAIVFNSLRGKKLDEIRGKIEEDARKKADEDRKIVGEISTTGSPAPRARVTKLTEEQEKEMKDMGFESAEDYQGRLDKRRESAKRRGAKRVPDTLSERLVLA